MKKIDVYNPYSNKIIDNIPYASKLDVENAIMGDYLIAGQVCIGVKRIIVEDSVDDEFVDLLVKSTEKLVLRDPLNDKTYIRLMITEIATKNVENLVKRAVESGAELVCGGKREGNMFEPTVLDNVNRNMDIIKNEAFGPIAPIRINDINKAISVANSSIMDYNLVFLLKTAIMLLKLSNMLNHDHTY